MLMYVITGPEGDGFVCEDVEVCLANMGDGEGVYAVTYEEVGRELVFIQRLGDGEESVLDGGQGRWKRLTRLLAWCGLGSRRSG